MSARMILVLRSGCRLCGGYTTVNRIRTTQWLQSRAYANDGRERPHFMNRRRPEDAEVKEMSNAAARKEMNAHHTRARVHIKNWTQADRLEKVDKFVDEMSENHLIPETRTMNDAMKAFSTRTEYVPKAFAALNKLFENGKTPNDRTFVQLFNMCAVHFPDHYDSVLSLHRTLNRRRFTVSLPVANAAIKAFAKYGDSNMAIKVFMDMQKRELTKREADIVEETGGHRAKRSWSRSRHGVEEEEDLLPEEEEAVDDGSSVQPDFRAGQKLHSMSPAPSLVNDDVIQQLFTPYAGLRPNATTYVSLLSVAARDSRHRLFRPSNYLAANLPKLEEVWTPDVRRRYSLAMADAIWNHLVFRDDKPVTVEAFVALLTAYRDGGRVDFMPLSKDFADEHRKQLLIQKGQLRSYDASHELMSMTGERSLAAVQVEQKAELDKHLDLVYPDDADDAVAAFWTHDAEALKQPLSDKEKQELDRKVMPFGGPTELLQAMTSSGVAPNTAVFHVMWQCQVSAITGGPINSRQPLRSEVRAELGELDTSQLLTLMQKYHCAMDERFFDMMLKHQALSRNYDAAMRVLHSAPLVGIELSLRHYCDAAHACCSQAQGFDMLIDLQEHGLTADAGVYECLAMAALHRRQYGWLHQVFKVILKSGLVPTEPTIAAVRRALSEKSYQKNVKHDKAQFRHFNRFYAFFTKHVLPLAEPEPGREFQADEDSRSFLGLDQEPSGQEEESVPDGWTPLPRVRRQGR